MVLFRQKVEIYFLPKTLNTVNNIGLASKTVTLKISKRDNVKNICSEYAPFICRRTVRFVEDQKNKNKKLDKRA